MSAARLKTPLTQAAAIVGVSLLLGLLFDRFFFDRQPGLSFPMYVMAVVGGIGGLGYYMGRRLSTAGWLLMIPLVGFASMVAVRSNGLLTLLNVVACLLLLLLIAQVAFHRRLTSFRVEDFIRLPFLPLHFLAPAQKTLAQFSGFRSAMQAHPTMRQVARGLAITIPILVVFGALFASADLIVHKYITDLVDVQIDAELTARVLLISLASLGFIGGYSYMFGASQPAASSPTMPVAPHLGRIEGLILFCSVNVLFFVFILVQLAYLFGGQAQIAAQGFSYAEYARKGFFELLAVAVATFVLVWWAEKRAAKTEYGHTALFKILSSALVVQVIVIMGSAFKRLYMYEQAYGFTTLRLYSHAFTVLLAIIFIILAYKIIRSASDQAFAWRALLAVGLFLVVMNGINPDAFIARQNIDRYAKTGKIDSVYLRQLSDDAVPALISGSASLSPDKARPLELELYRRRSTVTVNPAQDPLSWNYSRARAAAALAERR